MKKDDKQGFVTTGFGSCINDELDLSSCSVFSLKKQFSMFNYKHIHFIVVINQQKQCMKTFQDFFLYFSAHVAEHDIVQHVLTVS